MKKWEIRLTEEEKEEIVKMKEISRQTLEALSLEDETKSAEIPHGFPRVKKRSTRCRRSI